MPATIEVSNDVNKNITYESLPLLAIRKRDGALVFLSKPDEQFGKKIANNERCFMQTILRNHAELGVSSVLRSECLGEFKYFNDSVSIKNN